MQDELWRLGASDLAAAIRAKQASSREVVQAHLDRIGRVNGMLNAVTALLAGDALRAADEADAVLMLGDEIGPLHGVPMTVKENIDLAGSPTTEGIAALRDALPKSEAPHVTHLKRAGAIPIGRTNMPDFGLRWHTANGLRGATLNPWDVSRTPGGSSGGEAVSLATGMTPLGLGNDYGGSVRFPSQCCGTTAIRPTLGRVAAHSSLAASEFAMTIQLFAVQGPMARHVRDLRLALQIMSRPDARDPWWTPAPLDGPPLAHPIRVAVAPDPADAGVDPDVADGVRRAARCLEEAGYAVEEVQPPALMEAAELYVRLAAADIRVSLLPALEDIVCEDSRTFVGYLLGLAPEPTLQSYVDGLAARCGLARQWTQFAENYPLILGPITTAQPFVVGYDTAGQEQVRDFFHSLRLLTTVNLLGLPSVAVPVGIANGLPQGVQIIGPRYREDLCLDAAEAIERAVGPVTPIDPAW